ncbi:MAG: hypothetical protein KDA89_16460 [Planctomycetaceae bacterium]|nr:hypothetical protein [Planctomycetaceae bacterium]
MASTSVVRPPSAPRALGYAAAFFITGIGVLRCVEPMELCVRALLAGLLTWMSTHLFSRLWERMSDAVLDAKEHES